MTNNNTGITDGVTAHMVRGNPDLRQTARNRIAERILGAINQSLIAGRGNIGDFVNDETAETILRALEALGWTPPEGGK